LFDSSYIECVTDQFETLFALATRLFSNQIVLQRSSVFPKGRIYTTETTDDDAQRFYPTAHVSRSLIAKLLNPVSFLFQTATTNDRLSAKNLVEC
jgi:hypothetical protein